jgi:malate dehydrogenase (oxaloacetate-decarboxylating)(NADP+)
LIKIVLVSVCSAHPAAFTALLVRHAALALPYVYTPTVGEACARYHELPLKPRGLYLTLADRGAVLQKLRAWPVQSIAVVVVTDGERVLGLGDLGAGGLAICEGKILLYTAVGGVPPSSCLPLALDVGTNNERLLADPRYRGVRAKRPDDGGAALDGLVQELCDALREWRPHVLLQFEDFANHAAFRLLARHRQATCCFNDDVQGTASVALAALLAAARAAGGPVLGRPLLFYGAGEAGTGIADLVVAWLVARRGWGEADAARTCVFVDSRGLLCAARPDAAAGGLPPHKQRWAHAGLAPATDLASIVASVRPAALIGVSAVGGAFSAPVLAAAAAAAADRGMRPVVMPLSNPTHLAECTLQGALDGTGGAAVVATGSPFPPATCGRAASQANNAYIFPPLGHAALLTRAARLPDSAFMVAAEALAAQASDADLGAGLLFPPFDRAADVAAAVCAAVGAHLVAAGVGTEPAGVAYAASARRAPGVTAWEAHVRTRMVNLQAPVSAL